MDEAAHYGRGRDGGGLTLEWPLRAQRGHTATVNRQEQPTATNVETGGQANDARIAAGHPGGWNTYAMTLRARTGSAGRAARTMAQNIGRVTRRATHAGGA